jgi:RNA polymerase sigma factor (sigma-70 family)
MVRLATLLVDRVELAEELVQESFAAVFERWDRLDAPAGYLRTTVVNRCRDALRWRRRRGAAAAGAPTGPLLDLTSAPAEPVDHLREAIRSLPVGQRTAIVLRFYADLSVEDAAMAMGTRPGTVKSLVHRGLASLREVIDHDA